MYSPKKTWLRYRVWRWRLFSSGWKEAVNLRLNHSICWKILKIFRKIWKCKYKYKYDWRNRSLRAVWKSSHILSTRGTFGRPLNWTWRLKILKTICDGLWGKTIREYNKVWKTLTINQKEQGESKQVKFLKLSHPFVRQAIGLLNPQIKGILLQYLNRYLESIEVCFKNILLVNQKWRAKPRYLLGTWKVLKYPLPIFVW